jgi:hypothetical protein
MNITSGIILNNTTFVDICVMFVNVSWLIIDFEIVLSHSLSLLPVTGVEQSSTKIISEESSSGKSLKSNILPIAGIRV